MDIESISFLNQLVDSLEKAGVRIEEAYKKRDYEEFEKLKKFILQVQKKIFEAMQ